MSRYISASAPVIVPTPTGDRITPWEDCIRALFNDQRLQKALNVFDLIDLRKRLLGLELGGPPVMVTDDEGKALAVCCTQCEIFTPAFLYAPGAEEFFRAITDAPTKAPSHLAHASLNEASS